MLMESKNNIVQISCGIGIIYSFYKFLKYLQQIQKFSNFKPKSKFNQLIANTPMYKLQTLSKIVKRNIYIKMESYNLNGSLKDRTVQGIVQQALKRKIINPKVHKLIEVTSGSTGISLASLAKHLGFELKLYLVEGHTTQQKINHVKAFGAEVEMIKLSQYRKITKELQDQSEKDKLEYEQIKKGQKKLEKGRKLTYYCYQFNNTNSQIWHQKTGEEIYQQLNGQIDYFVQVSGCGGTIAGISSKLKKLNKNIRIVLADIPGTCGEEFVYTKNKDTHYKGQKYFNIVDGTGSTYVSENLFSSCIDDAIVCQNVEILHMMYFVLRNEGIFIGVSTAHNLVCAVKIARKSKLGSNIVALMCDSGARYLETVFQKSFLEKKGINFEPRKNYENLDFVN